MLSSISVGGRGVASFVILIPAPGPPLHPKARLLLMVFRCMSGEPYSVDIPTPMHPRLFEMMFPVIVGDEFLMHIPPPHPKPLPLSTANPLSTEDRPSPEMNLTPESARFPSMSVTSGPPSLVTVMALPERFMFST